MSVDPWAGWTDLGTTDDPGPGWSSAPGRGAHWFLPGGTVVHADDETPEAECELCQTGRTSWPVGDSGIVATLEIGAFKDGDE